MMGKPASFYSAFNGENQLSRRYLSRVKIPKDNPEIERFNQTLE
jgi:hypothetical protein